MANPTDFDGTKATDQTDELDPADSPSHENAETEGAGDTDDAKITLSKEQLDAANLGDLEPGDAFTVTLKGTVTDKGDANGITADIDELMDGRIEGVINNGPAPAAPLPKGPTVKGPAAAGMLTASSPMLPDDNL